MKLVVGKDGSIFLSYRTQVIKLRPDGALSIVAGTKEYGFSGDGGQATLAMFNGICDIAIDSDESLYISDCGNQRIRKVGQDGIITTVAGKGLDPATGTSPFGGDGGLATDAFLAIPLAIAVAGDGSIYIGDAGHHRIRKVGPDGIISTIAGNGESQYYSPQTGDGGLAIAGAEDPGHSIAVSTDGRLYYVEGNTRRIRVVGTDGIVRTVAGTGKSGSSVDGVPATSTDIDANYLAVSRDGYLYFSSYNTGFIKRVSPDGILSTVAGGGDAEFRDKKPARSVFLSPIGLAIDPNGTLLSVHIIESTEVTLRGVIFRVRPLFPENTTGDVVIASEDGTEIYHFDASGRHLRTLSTLTGATLYQFGYDPSGRLVSVTDANGGRTSIERDESGTPLAIVAPFGQRTSVSLDENGHVASITNPAGESHRMTYTPSGLLTSFTTPVGARSTISYDSDGFLVRDAGPEGGSWEITGVKTLTGQLVSMTSAMGKTSSYLTERVLTGEERRTVTGPGGNVTRQVRGADGVLTTTEQDGTITNTTLKPDPRFGMMSPIADTTVKLPSGLTNTTSTIRSAVLSDAKNDLTLASQLTTTSVNGKQYSLAYDASAKKFSNKTPAGRFSYTTVDYLSRPVTFQADPTLTPVTFIYNANGFPERMSQGSLVTSFGYDPLGRRVSSTNALGQRVTYGYDLADRVTRIELPSKRTYEIDYNQAGQMISLKMPKGNVHSLDYTLLGMDQSYTPPASNPYSWSYNPDREWVQSKLPSGKTISAGYDAGGRPTGLSYSEASVDYVYTEGDKTDRINSIIRTPVVGGTPQRITYAYDGSLVTQAAVSGITTGSTSYRYDNDFQLSSINLTSGGDSFNSEIKRDDDGLITQFGPFTYTRQGPAGAVSAITDSTLKLTFSYDDLGRISGKRYVVDTTPVFVVDYTYDPVGRISSMTEDGTTTYTYLYDSDGQLSERKQDGVTLESYQYDPNGNLVRETRGMTTKTYSYDSQDRILTGWGEPFIFDADGFLTKGGFVNACSYSALGELLTATASGETIRYSYDGLGRRIARTGPGGTHQYFYANTERPFQVSAVRDTAGVLSGFYYDTTGALFAMKRGASTFYVASDHLGTPRVVTDSSGNVIKRMDYDSFGYLKNDSNPSFDLPIGFAGGIRDTTTGLVRFGYRDYDPANERWVSRDPILYKSRQANLYQYVGNNPVNFTDPTGQFIFVPVLGWSAASALSDLTIAVAVTWWLQDHFDDLHAPIAFSRPSSRTDSERATDIPSWTSSYPQKPGESCSDYAKRVLDEKYGCGHKKAKRRGPGSEYSQIKKGCERK